MFWRVLDALTALLPSHDPPHLVTLAEPSSGADIVRLAQSVTQYETDTPLIVFDAGGLSVADYAALAFTPTIIHPAIPGATKEQMLQQAGPADRVVWAEPATVLTGRLTERRRKAMGLR
jgi:hypothetical protein